MANTQRFLTLGVVFSVVGASGLVAMERLHERPASGKGTMIGASGMSLMNGGMMSQEEMKRMMQTMMPGQLPPAIKPEDLPDAGSPGAKLMVHYCAQCHNLPSPAMHTANEWPIVAERMREHMKSMGKAVITDRERDEIVGYLTAKSSR